MRQATEKVLLKKIPQLKILFNDGFETDDSMRDIDFEELNGVLKEKESDDEETFNFSQGFASYNEEKGP